MTRFLSLILCVAALAAADPAALPGADKTDSWKPFMPKDKDGTHGKVELSAADSGLAMAFDFSTGGPFVALKSAMAVPAGINAITMDMSATTEVGMKFRVVTADGRTFSGCPTKLKPGATVTATLPLDKAWNDAWGGPGDSKVPSADVKQIMIQIMKPKAETTGTVMIKGIKTIAK